MPTDSTSYPISSDSPPADKTAPNSGNSTTKPLLSLDTYRGLIMLALATGGFKLVQLVREATSRREELAQLVSNGSATAADVGQLAIAKSSFWQTMAHQLSHVPWRGCVAEDMIQPSFMFMVGVAMAYSYAKRQKRGDSYTSMLLHAVIRSIALVALGVFLSSNWSKQTNFTFANVLCQIGLGYTFLFLLWGRKPIVQFLVAAVILVGYWGWFAWYPLPVADFNYSTVGVPADWEHLTGFEAHWDKNTNPAAAFDLWFLNIFPQEKKFEFNRGGYATLNFIPSLATMIFGLLAGGLLRGKSRELAKFAWLVLGGLLALGAGYALDHYGVCPIVKRIWTPSWALFSSGCALLILATFYLVIDIWGARARFIQKMTLPVVVVGMNSIAMYCMGQVMKPWVAHSLRIHLRKEYQTLYGLLANYWAPTVEAAGVFIVLWLICIWLYRQKAFLRL